MYVSLLDGQDAVIRLLSGEVDCAKLDTLLISFLLPPSRACQSLTCVMWLSGGPSPSSSRSVTVSANLTGAGLCVPQLQKRGRVIGHGQKEGEKIGCKALVIRGPKRRLGARVFVHCSRQVCPSAQSIIKPSRSFCTTTR